MEAPFENIADTLTARAQLQPHQEAVIFPSGRDAFGRVAYTHLTFAQLDQLSTQVARGLLAKGIGQGLRTAFLVKPSLEFFVLTFALFKAKAVPVLIDPGIGIRSLRTCLKEAQAKAFLGIPAAHMARILFRWKGAGWTHLVSVSSRSFGSMICYQELLKAGAHPSAPQLPMTRSEEQAAILFTSGSTGSPKGAVYTHANFLAQVRLLQKSLQIQPGERDLCTFPLFALFAPALGMTAVIPEMDFTRPGSVDPLKIKEAIDNFGIHNMFGSPALIKRVGAWGSEQGWHFPSLQRVISAGAPVPAPVIANFRKLLPESAQFFTPYGATESLPVAIAESRMLLEDTQFLTREGHGLCIGTPAPETEVRILRITDEAMPQFNTLDLMPVGQIGEIAVAGPQRTLAYEQRPEADRLAKALEGSSGTIFHRMGDLGYLDSKGRLWFCGRRTQRVQSSQGPLYTIPCEAIFNQHPQIARSALIGLGKIPHQVPAICIEVHGTLSPKARTILFAELRELALRYEHTRSIEHFFVHPRFPVDIRHNAKIFREKLKIWADSQWQKRSLSPAAVASLAKPSSLNS